MQQDFRIATFNIHKGSTHFDASFALHQQKALLQQLHVDVVFLQEVQDVHLLKSKRYLAWPAAGQAEFLADSVWPDYAYGKNSEYPAGHHGNALLSKYPIINTHNKDISAHTSEKRGMLHCEINVIGWDKPLHAICLHLGLFAHWRQQQLLAVADYIEAHVPADAALIIAGDFNDWSTLAGKKFAQRLHLQEVFEHHTGQHARSFPSWLPMLRLDRIYVRGFEIKSVEVHSGPKFIKLSDHAILTATLTKI